MTNIIEMRKISRHTIGVFLLTALLSACDSPSVQDASNDAAKSTPSKLVQIDNATTGLEPFVPASIEIDGNIATLLQTREERVAFVMNSKMQLLDENLEVKGGNRFQLHQDGNHLYALWWSHKNGKSLYFAVSSDNGKSFSPTQVVNDQHGVLAPFSLLTGKDGVLGMTYMDERQPNYQVYFNRSTDHGLTWPRPDTRLDTPPEDGQVSVAMFPYTVKTSDAWVTVWTDTIKSMGRNVYRVITRRSTDEGLTWAPSVSIYSSQEPLESFNVHQHIDRVIVTSVIHDKGIIALASNDQGATWKHSDILGGTENLINSGLSTTIAENKAHLVWIEESSEIRPRIMTSTLNMDRATWDTPPKRLDIKEEDKTYSTLPKITSLANGTLAAAWIDYRDIRSNVYVSASFDQGLNWTTPQALETPGMLSASRPRWIEWNDGLAIGYQIYPEDKELEGDYVVRALTLEPPRGFALNTSPKILPKEKRLAMLEDRVKTFWKYRTDGKFDLVYPYFDHAYRAATPLEAYMQPQGALVYHSAKITNLSINGNEAQVDLTINYEVKPTLIAGKMVTLPPKDFDVSNTWVWVGDNWYMHYKPAVGDAFLKY